MQHRRTAVTAVSRTIVKPAIDARFEGNGECCNLAISATGSSSFEPGELALHCRHDFGRGGTRGELGTQLLKYANEPPCGGMKARAQGDRIRCRYGAALRLITQVCPPRGNCDLFDWSARANVTQQNASARA